MRTTSACAASVLLAIHAAMAAAAISPPATPDRVGESSTRIVAGYGALPLAFEANRGQAEGAIRYMARGHGFGLALTDDEARLYLQPAASSAPMPRAPRIESAATAASAPGALVRMRFANSNRGRTPAGVERLESVSHYLRGNDPARWQRDVPNYAKVRYADLYPGIDLVYYGNERTVEYDFVVAPGADPRRIRLAFAGAERVAIDRDGNLVLATRAGTLVQAKPRIYQTIDGARHPIAGRYVIAANGRVGFDVARYDRTRALVIDPTLAYLTYVGGGAQDNGSGIAVDRAGSAYIVGSTGSTFPIELAAYQTSYGGGVYDAFVVKLNPAGTARVYSTYIGGSAEDVGAAIAIDAAGNAYIAGYTKSNNFPTTPGAFQQAYKGVDNAQNAFVSKLSPAGSSLLYSTYVGGTKVTLAQGIAVDAQGFAYVTGFTVGDYPVTAGAYQTTYGGGGDDVFVTKVNANGTALVYSTYVGGTDYDSGAGIAVDLSGNAYVAGSSHGGFPTTAGAFQPAYGGDNRDGVVFKLNPSGSALVYSTYLGGSAKGNDTADAIAVDSAGFAYAAGQTPGGFPVTAGAYQTTYGGGQGDAWVAKLNQSGSALLYATYIGGSGDDWAGGIAIDARGNAYVNGATSGNFPITAGALQDTYGGGREDVFIAKVNPAGSALLYSTYLGTAGDDYGYGLALDTYFNLYVTGNVGGGGLPTTAGVVQPGYGGGAYDAFVAKFAGDADASVNRQGVYWASPAGSESGWGVFAHHQGDTVFANWFTFGFDGAPTWMVFSGTGMPGLPNVYSGAVYTGTGPPFSAFDPALVVPISVGSATLSFTGPDDGFFSYALTFPDGGGAIAQTKPITREVFATPVPTCRFDAAADPAFATNYQGIWWRLPAGVEPGWGLAIAHQGDTLFVAWFTYGQNGKATWFVVAADKAGPGTYTGTLYRATSGPPLNAVPFDPAQVQPQVAGTATLTFSDGNNGFFAYTVDDVAQGKPITRQVFANGWTICQ